MIEEIDEIKVNEAISTIKNYCKSHVNCEICSYKGDVINGGFFACKFMNRPCDWDSEILTKEEKKYLKGIINPFRKYVICIYKKSYGNGSGEGIIIQNSEHDGRRNGIVLPSFAKGQYYKGLEIDKKYKLEELGLNNEK